MSSEIMINELEFDKCRNVDILLLYHTNLSKPKIYTYRYLTTISLKDLNLIEEYLTHMLIFNILTYYRQTLRFYRRWYDGQYQSLIISNDFEKLFDITEKHLKIITTSEQQCELQFNT